MQTHIAAVTAQGEASASDWHNPSSPYRLTISLEEAVSGQVELDLSTSQFIEALAGVSVDPIDEESFAFDRSIAIDPTTGKTVGRFQLVRAGKPFDIDGGFTGLRKKQSPWLGFMPANMRFKPTRIGDQTRNALLITKDKIANQKLQQTVSLTPGHRYLLEYWIMMDVQDNLMGVMLYDPELILFAPLPHSYVSKSPPRGEWGFRQMLFRPDVDTVELAVRPDPEDAYLRVSHVFTGTGGVADIALQEVEWKLILDTDKPIQTIELYTVARSGHRLTSPTPQLIAQKAPTKTASVSSIESARLNINPNSVSVQTQGVKAWTIDGHLPLKLDTVSSYAPTKPTTDVAAHLDLFRGSSATLVFAIDNGKPRIQGLSATCDLPITPTFHRLATIPVYDGPTVDGEIKGNYLGTYYEAMVPLDFALDPDIKTGVHLVTATFTAAEDAPIGTSNGAVTITLPEGELKIPVELSIAPLVIKPQKHFGTNFGGGHILTRYRKGAGPYTQDSIAVAEYHGLDARGLEPPSMVGLSIPDNEDKRTTPARHIAEKYFHRMLDFHVQPESPALYAYFTYKIQEQGDGKAPKLTDWDFTGGYDDAINELVIGREMPWLVVGRTNGYLMSKIVLRNRKTYSTKANPDNPNWIQLPEDEFLQLVGDYWDNFAKHLHEKDLLDQTMYVIDECGPETYETILSYTRAMKSRPFASKIKIGHTAYKPAVWNYLAKEGHILMDEVLDVPMADNDDEFNFFDPEWNARFERPKENWVYYVETDHMNLENAGLSTVLTPLKLRHFGANGWYCWASYIWSMPYPYKDGKPASFRYQAGPVINPWENPYYHHGPGQLSFFYPPDPRGPAKQPTDLIIPSYRLSLMRDGIEMHALMDVLKRGTDDAGQAFKTDADAYQKLEQLAQPLWADNPVQWFLDYNAAHEFRKQIYELARQSEPASQAP